MNTLVIIPTHDRTGFVDSAVASVLAQTTRPYDILVTGNVAPSLVAARVRCEITEDSISTRVNRAIENSVCDAFVFLCDDDLLSPLFLEYTEAAMSERNVDIVSTYQQGFGLQQTAWDTEVWGAEIDTCNCIPVTALCKKEAWRRAGGYRDDGVFFDWDFWWRCYRTGATRYTVKERLFMYRYHDSGAGGDTEENRNLFRAQRTALKELKP